jgi:hypothetical protein
VDCRCDSGGGPIMLMMNHIHLDSVREHDPIYRAEGVKDEGCMVRCLLPTPFESSAENLS